MTRCIGGTGGGIDAYESEKYYYKSVVCNHLFGGLRLRQPPLFSLSKSENGGSLPTALLTFGLAFGGRRRLSADFGADA